MMAYDYPHPVSRTYQYKKITKPLLERKRRARINKCLDELKNLMIDALETEGEDISKLEKADILELTVRHLQRLQGSESCGSSSKITKNDEVSAESRWISGFGHCAAEAYRFLSSLPGEGAERLARHLAAGLQKCRQSNSSLKANLLTQILASLDLTTDSIAPSLTNATAENTRIPFPQENSGTHHGSVTDRHIFTASYQCSSTITIIKNEKLDTNCTSRSRDSKRHHVTKKVKSEVEDDEEIDVERIDEADPMWRPW